MNKKAGIFTGILIGVTQIKMIKLYLNYKKSRRLVLLLFTIFTHTTNFQTWLVYY